MSIPRVHEVFVVLVWRYCSSHHNLSYLFEYGKFEGMQTGRVCSIYKLTKWE
jgi:hypothetical protein